MEGNYHLKIDNHKENHLPKNSENLRISELFKACDTKGIGSIGPEEFSDLSNKFGISEMDSRVIFIDLDHDGDGKIDFDDFKHGFSDFLTPGSRRGSFQVNLTDGTTAMHQLMEMEKKHATAKKAWKHFVHNVGPTYITPLIKTNNCVGEPNGILDPRHGKNSDPDVSLKLENTLTSLISDVQNLHEEYKTLESSFRKEREAHVIQLAALGEELDHQLAKAEAKAKDEARQEAQRQMDAERKKITQEMESKLSDLTAQIKTFEKVEEWLSEEEARGKIRNSDESSKRFETETENRKLRSALVEAQMKASLLQSQLTQKRNEYHDLYQEFHSEKVAANEYRNQCDLMQNHLSILRLSYICGLRKGVEPEILYGIETYSQANRVLSDANDCFSNSSYGSYLPPVEDGTQDSLPLTSGFSSLNLENNESLPLTKQTLREHKYRSLSPSINTNPQNSLLLSETDRDSGRDTLFDELRAESESSPLPSGHWSEISSTTTEGSPILQSKSSLNSTSLPRELMAPILPPPITFQTLNAPKHVPHRTFKVILAGDAAVGKTSFIERACHGHFAAHLSSTIGVDFRVKSMEIDGNCIALQLWDTAGQERFRSLTKSYFRRADGVILMYDVAVEQTFLSIRHWIQNVEECAGRRLPVIICGNKVDLRADWYKGGACVSHEEGLKLSREFGALFIEVSPKTGFNVLNTLVLITTEMSLVEDAELRSSVLLNDFSNEGKTRKRSCCGNAQEGQTLKEI